MTARKPDMLAAEAAEVADGKVVGEVKTAPEGEAIAEDEAVDAKAVVEEKPVVDGKAAEEEEVKSEDKEEDDLSDEALSRLAPDLANDDEAMDSLKELRDLQKGHDEVFEEYLKEKQKLEESFERRFAPFFAKRRTVLDKGRLGEFWFRCFENCDILANNLTDKDGLAMQYLVDLSCETVTKETVEKGTSPEGLHPGSYILRFKFRENPFFHNEVLTKTYAMSADSFDDFPIASGCEINWKQGKNLTVRVFRKKAKNGRVLMKTEPADSFFNFFNPPDGVGDDVDMKSDVENVVEADVELGEAIRNDLIPRALYYYLDMEDDDDEEDEEDENGEGLPNGALTL